MILYLLEGFEIKAAAKTGCMAGRCGFDCLEQQEVLILLLLHAWIGKESMHENVVAVGVGGTGKKADHPR